MARILIVEDEVDLAELYRASLEADGHEVIGVFDDPERPIAQAEAIFQKAPPDLVILDERVRNGSGTAFIPQLRRVFPSAQILVATADPEVAVTAIERGADEVKRKPFTLQHLVENVRSLVGICVPSCAPSEALRETRTVQECLTRAQHRSDNGDTEGALAACTEAIEIDPGSAKAYCNRGALRTMLGDFDGAVVDCTEAVRCDPGLALAWYNRGLAHERKRDFDAALADYSQALRLDPTHADAYNNRGIVRCMTNDLEAAIRDFNEAIRLDANDPDAYCNRGLAHYRLGSLADALLDLRKALEVAPQPWPHRSDVKKALKEIRKMLA